MSDIGLTGVPTTGLNKVGGMGEVQSANNFPGIDAFGGVGRKIPQQQIDNFGNEIRNVNFSDLKSQLQNVASTAESFLDGVFNRLGRGGDLKYPLETDNPAYQARVSFKMVSMKSQIDG